MTMGLLTANYKLAPPENANGFELINFTSDRMDMKGKERDIEK